MSRWGLHTLEIEASVQRRRDFCTVRYLMCVWWDHWVNLPNMVVRTISEAV